MFSNFSHDTSLVKKMSNLEFILQLHPFSLIFDPCYKIIFDDKNVKFATTENILSSFPGLAGQITRFDLSNHFCIFLTHNSIPSIKPSTLLKTLEQLDFVQCFIGGRLNKKNYHLISVSNDMLTVFSGSPLEVSLFKCKNKNRDESDISDETLNLSNGFDMFSLKFLSQ